MKRKIYHSQVLKKMAANTALYTEELRQRESEREREAERERGTERERERKGGRESGRRVKIKMEQMKANII